VVLVKFNPEYGALGTTDAERRQAAYRKLFRGELGQVDEIRQCFCISPIGHFASVALVSVNQPFQSQKEQPVPLWRGHAMNILSTGTE
jgi:hypothetical protein